MIVIANERKIVQINNNLLNAITPFGGMEYFRIKIYLGENVVKIFMITKYPPTLRAGWSAKLSNLPNTIFTQVFEPCDNGTLITDLASSVTRQRSIADNTRDPLERQRAERAANDAEKLMKQIDQNSEVIGYMSNIIMVSGRDEEQLEMACRSLESAVSALGCKIRLLTNQQKEAFKTVSPYNVPVNDILKLAKRNVPMSTVQGGFPLTSNGFIDKDGYIIGIDTQNGLIAVNIWERHEDRTNSNIVVIGVPGVGKSALVKSIMIKERMLGTVCIVIDPEREYADLAFDLGGDVILAGGGGFVINPLQIKTVPIDDENEEGVKIFANEEGKGMSPLALHFKSLEIFFKLYVPEITSMQMAILKQVLEDLYASFNIFWNTDVSRLKNTDYPIFSDLYNLITDIREKNVTQMEADYRSAFMALELIVRELANGSDQFLWNGHTSVESTSKFIVLDTNDLQDTSDNVKKAQYYVLLTWAWERMSRDRQEKVMLFADEAYLLIDPRVPQSLIYLRNIEKRSRKYESGLCVISHSVIDFLDPSVRMYGQALLDIPTYKFIMGADGQNLQDLTSLYNLTEVEQEKLAAKKRGHAIFFVGSRRFLINIKISEGNLQRMGSAGGK